MERKRPQTQPELGLLPDLIQVGHRISMISNPDIRGENVRQSPDDDGDDDDDDDDANCHDGRPGVSNTPYNHSAHSTVSDTITVVNEYDDVLLDEKVISIKLYQDTRTKNNTDKTRNSTKNDTDKTRNSTKNDTDKTRNSTKNNTDKTRNSTKNNTDKTRNSTKNDTDKTCNSTKNDTDKTRNSTKNDTDKTHNSTKSKPSFSFDHKENNSPCLDPATKKPNDFDGKRNGKLNTYGSTCMGVDPEIRKNIPRLNLPAENETTSGDNASCSSVSRIFLLKKKTTKMFTFAKGLLSDDGRSTNTTSRVYSTGRRSAPIFSRRVYGSSGFWTSRENVNVQPTDVQSQLSSQAAWKDTKTLGSKETRGKAAEVRIDSKRNVCYRNHTRPGYFSEWDSGKGRDVRKRELLRPKRHLLLSGDPTSTDENIDNDEVEWITSNEPDGFSSSRCTTPRHNGCVPPHSKDGRTVDLFVKENNNNNNNNNSSKNISNSNGHKYDTFLTKPISPSHELLGDLDHVIDLIHGKRQDDVDEKCPLLAPRSSSSAASSSKPPPTKTAAYKKRWYLLLAFSLYSFIYNVVWATWGPIAQSAKAVFSWSDGNIAMFTWLGTIPLLVVTFPLAYLMDVKGMRISMLLCCGLTFLGTGLRCISSSPDEATWLNYSGQLLNGVAGTVPLSGAALLSGLWFPASQRATATGIATVTGYLGACFSFIVGPLVVPEPHGNPPINTSNYHGLPSQGQYDIGLNLTDTSELRDGIMNILYYECGAAGIIFVLVLLYFPSRPTLPPSISASLPREPYVDGLKMLVRNQQFWMTCIAYGVPIGVYEVWQVVLDVILYPRVSQETAGWLDFYGTLGGCIVGLLVSRFADLFTHQIKFFLIVFYLLASGAILWFNLLVLDILPFDIVSVYIACIIIGVCLDGSAPLFFELVIEVSYPAGEGVTSGLLQIVVASAGTAFLSLLQIESLGKEWVNWCFLGCCCLSIPLLVLIRTNFLRANLDAVEVTVTDEEEEQEETRVTDNVGVLVDTTGKK